ncbi:hypothetical protein L198_03543 [Cryptococcus wingfieldii CBS 7118]|uniref:Uncharacterized protein n=1 Tax=Cryptococcus wingfieldii CBS 7118 TaxID=1295528 RepID=A0A1E3JBP3_9TREE|nr:hypothetical protein L198_03543 [Cryptococcus wingfieldii CBS 7118]ODN98300.1 hypothetical protein L198_03543 [Cryptococcus wingfieldii CBS 7118]
MSNNASQALRDSDGFAMPAPPPTKRHIKPTEAQPTTAEIYAQKHGIPLEVQLALQNVGSRARMSVSRGQRTFDRHQSSPALGSASATPNYSPFTSSLDAITHARGVMNKELMRARELQPFGSLSPTNSSDNLDKDRARREFEDIKLKFRDDGEVELEGEVERRVAFGQGSSASAQRQGEKFTLTRSTKRASSPAEEDEHAGSETETSDQEDEEENRPFARTPSFNTVESVFPPVFNTPAISHPQLFTAPNPVNPVQQPAAPSRKGRAFKGLPGGKKSALAKAYSAPVLGGWANMEVDVPEGSEKKEEQEDGFELDWSKDMDF